ncbi:MAG TPA: response regulator [Terriglobia bacterium]|nr:response regulator [Terriglobia bacterium]
MFTGVQQKERKLAGISVLVVEDDPDAQELIACLLEQNDATVTCFGTVPDALSALKNLSPDVLVVDIGLPGYNGFTFIGRVRALADPCKRNLPAIALTAYSTTTDRDTVLMSGFQTFMTKPFDCDVLIQTIASAASSNRNTA